MCSPGSNISPSLLEDTTDAAFNAASYTQAATSLITPSSDTAIAFRVVAQLIRIGSEYNEELFVGSDPSVV